MSSLKPTLNQADISLLKKTFASDLQNLEHSFKSVGAELEEVKTSVKINTLRLHTLERDLKTANFRLAGLEKQIAQVDKRLGKVERYTKKLYENINMIIDHFDVETLDHKKRLERVETHLQLPPLAD